MGEINIPVQELWPKMGWGLCVREEGILVGFYGMCFVLYSNLVFSTYKVLEVCQYTCTFSVRFSQCEYGSQTSGARRSSPLVPLSSHQETAGLGVH